MKEQPLRDWQVTVTWIDSGSGKRIRMRKSYNLNRATINVLARTRAEAKDIALTKLDITYSQVESIHAS